MDSRVSDASITCLLKGGRLLDPASGHDGRGDVRIAEGVITEVGADLVATAEPVVDCGGLWVMPGFVDLHTHLREPGFEDAEDIATGSAAAAAGGYTAVCAMANTDPVCDSATVAESVWRRGREVGLVDVVPIGAITKGLAGVQLAEMGELYACGAQVRMFSDDGRPVADALIMRRALQYATRFGAVICNHAQDLDLTATAQCNEGRMSSLLGLAGWPHEAEEVMVARDLILAAGVGARLHVPHVSTRGTVELIRLAKARGVSVSAEVTPHHLTLDESVTSTYDPVFKVNPPVRTTDDVAALWAGLADGTIDAVATDHAPHPVESKDQEWDLAPCGMLGLETAFPVVLSEVVSSDETRLDLLTAIAAFTTGPVGVGAVGSHSVALTAGNDANIAVIDPAATWTVFADRLRSRASNTPFEGRRLTGRVVHTLLRGRFTLRDGQVQW